MPRQENWVGLVEASRITGLGFTPLYRLRTGNRVRTRTGKNGRIQWHREDLLRVRDERTAAAPAAT